MSKKHYKNVIKLTSELIPYVGNSRTHSDEQIKQIASSIKEFGFTNPVLIDDGNGIIAGHGRVLAANKLNLTDVPCIVLTGLTEAQKKAYIIADNQLPLNAGWNLDTLKIELETLQELDFDLDLLGFDDDFINHLIIWYSVSIITLWHIVRYMTNRLINVNIIYHTNASSYTIIPILLVCLSNNILLTLPKLCSSICTNSLQIPKS